MIDLLHQEDEAELTMKDIFDPIEVNRALAHLQCVRDNACAALRSASKEQLVIRPEPGTWSAIENLRHMIFAEDLYLNRWILRNSKPWLPVGLLPAFWANDTKFEDVGKDATEDLGKILAIWSELHGDTMQFVLNVTAEKLKAATNDVDFGQGTVGAILQQLAKHDFWHIGKVQSSINCV